MAQPQNRSFIAYVRKGLSVLALTSAAVTSLSSAAHADQAAMITCIENYKRLGVSADAALAQCKESSLAECVKRLVGQDFQATAVKNGPEGFLIDLGNDDSRWMEGGPWRALGCTPYEDGPKRRQQALTTWGFDSVNTWFRQGWCSKVTITLDQPYTLEDAKLRCELGIAPAPKE